MKSAAVMWVRRYYDLALVFLTPFLVYLLTLPHTVTGEDSGELITAAFTLGVAHPPGYPIWCLLAHGFTYFPLFSIAWRVAFMSAVFGAATVVVLYLILKHLTGHRWLSAAAAVAFGFSSEFWEQAVIAEVYTLNAFFIALCVLLLLHWQATRNDRCLYAFAVTYGLSLCNHSTMQLLGPIFVVFVLLVDPYFWRRLRVYVRCTLLAASCLLIYAYLPIRSLANPPVDWGNPENWDNFYAHVTRAQYKFALEENPRSLELLGWQVLEFFKSYAWEFAPWLCWLPALGVVPLWNKDRRAFVMIGLILFACSFGLIFILNFSIDRTSLWLNNVFWIPAYMMAAILTGVGLAWVWQRNSKAWRSAVAFAAIACVLSPLALNYYRNDKSSYYFASDFAKNTLLSLDENAIYFPTADHATFPVLYFQACEGLRPGVIIANKYGYPEASLYADMPEAFRREVGAIPNSAQEAIIEKWIVEHNPERPVYFTRKRSMQDLPDHEMVEHGIVFTVRQRGADPEPLPWDEYSWRILTPEKTRGELTADSILADVYYMRGRAWLKEGETENGLNAFDISAKLGPESKEMMNNLGSACAEFGLADVAIDYYTRCVELAPGYSMARKNLAQVYLSQADTNNALLQFEAYLEEEPNDPQVLRASADCMARIGWYRDAITRLEYLLRLTPNDASVYRTIGQYYEEGQISIRQANTYYAKSLELDPTQQDLLAKLNPGTQEQQIPGLPGQTPGAERPAIPGLDLPAMPSLPQIPVPGAGASLPGGPQIPGGL